jgi:hypothetical protein
MVNGFGELPLDTDANPFQRMDCVKVTSDGASADQLLGLAGFVYPKIDRLIDHLMQDREPLLDSIVDDFEKSRELTLLTNHLDVAAIAVAGGSILVALEKSGRIRAQEINTELFVSAMMKRTTLFAQPTVALITRAFPTLRFSIPSANENNRTIAREVREPFNTASTSDIDAHPSDKPTLRLAAGSSTSDRKAGRKFGARSKKNPTVHMGPMSDGNRALAERSSILGYGLDTGSEEPEFYIGEIIDPSTQQLGAHTVMIDIAQGMSTRSGYPRQYHMDRDSFDNAAPLGRRKKHELSD